MPKRRRILSIGSSSEGPHGDKPWVYFMVDCFFLITQFFLISFHSKEAMGWQLDRKVPPGNTKIDPNLPVEKSSDELLPVHLSQNGAQTTVLFQKITTDLATFSQSLRRVATAGHTVKVSLSYDGDVPYQRVIDVMNECERLRIKKCNLVPLRADQCAPR